MLTDVVAPEVLERDVAVPAAEQVEILPVQDAGVLAPRSGNPIARRTGIVMFSVKKEVKSFGFDSITNVS